MAKANRICSVEDCGKPVKGLGFCNKHYHRFKRTGTTDPRGNYAERGSVYNYLIQHMHEDCPKWPFARNPQGYGHLQHNGAVVSAHRLVCLIVYGDPPTADHDAAHNCGKGHEGCFGARCLSWKTKAENQSDRIRHLTSNRGERHGNSKLTEDKVREIRRRALSEPQAKIARQMGISRAAVSDIVRRTRWAWLK